MNAPTKIDSNRPALITADLLAKDFAHIETAIAVLETRGKEMPPVIEDDEDLAVINELVVDLRKAGKRADEIRDEQKRPYLEAGNTVQAFFKSFEHRADTLKAQLETRAKRYLDKKRDEERARQAEEEKRARAEAERREEEARAAAAKGDETGAAIAANQARAANEQAEASGVAATAKSADLARTHTSAGTATLIEDFDVKVLDWEKVDLEILRPYIRRDEIDKALRAILRARKPEVAAGTFKITGVQFVPITRAQLR
jgi:hypothetical protein